MSELRFTYKGLIGDRHEFWSNRSADEGGMLRACNWCVDQFGARQSPEHPDYRWSSDYYDMVYIRNHLDAMAFRFRWC